MLVVTGSGSGTTTSTATASTTATVASAGLLAANAGGPYSGTTGQTVSFDGSKSTALSGQTLTYAWNFGDGATGTGISPTHVYSSAANYTVTLTVTASGGGTAAATSTATITAAVVLTANAGGPYMGASGQAINFDGSKSTAPTGQTVSYAWNFGDGATGTGVNPTHSYANAGTFTVSLTATASGGGTNTAITTATITAIGSLTASAGGPYSGVTGQTITFDGSGSTAPAGQTISYTWNFGDSGTAVGVKPTHTYTAAGNYFVTLTLTSSGGGTATATTTAAITAAGALAANPGGPYAAPANQSITFDGSKSTAPSGQTLSYGWTFGDGGTGTGVSPTHSYATAGSYTVTLTVTASGGGTATATAVVAITATAVPVAVAGGPYAGVVGTAVSFSGSASTAPSGQTLSYAWTFGDNSTGTGVSPTHSYATAGTYTLTLTVTASGGGTALSTAAVTITATPVPVAVAGGPYTGVVGTAVSFSGSASTAPSGQTLSYAWNFGDSSTDTGVSPTHSYGTAGSYTATLTVTASGGGTAMSTAMVTITAVPVPVAVAGGPYTGVVGTAVSFSGSASTAPSGQTLSYAWNFGDGGTGTGVSPTHSYATAGSYTATLIVTASGGGTATATAAVAITAVPAPIAVAGGPYTGLVGTAVSFSGSASAAPAGQTLSYGWNFGDGGTGTGVSPTHSYTTAGSYTVTLTVTASGGGTATATAAVAITAVPAPVAVAGGPYASVVGMAVSFSGSASTAPAGQTLSYAWTFGDGSTGTGGSPAHSYTTAGSYTVTLTVTASGGGMATATAAVTITAVPPPTISTISPASGPIGTLITLTGSNLIGSSGSSPQVTLTKQGGGTLSAPISSSSATSLTFVIPAGAATGTVTVTADTQSATSASALTVTTSSSFTVAVTPGTGTLIQGQSTALAVSVNSTNGFSGLATLAISGLPTGVTAAFMPTAVAAGQASVLTLTAPSSQAVSTSSLTITAAATIDGQSSTQTANASLTITAASTSLLGRTVVDDAQESPIGGVTIKFLAVTDKGNATGCSAQTVSDAAGNFLLSNLPPACIGPQLISYDGSTATSPSGKFAGVNLSYTFSSAKVTVPPVLIHLPRIDNAETVMVQQNAPTDQVFYFHTIPGVKITVYAGTSLSLDDGSQPSPFPLVALSIPLDRLPESMATTGMLMPFIVAFQPANAVASQPVAVNFPNMMNTAPGTNVTFMTLDPTHGYMVPYGTGTVSSDGTQFIADADPSHPGHGYGLVHFDWHGPAVPPGPAVPLTPGGGKAPSPPMPPCPVCPDPAQAAPTVGDPVDIGSGIVTYSQRDIGFSGARGGVAIHRVYRTLSSNAGPFGMGTSHEYNYVLNTQQFILTFLSTGSTMMSLTVPNGNVYDFPQTPNGSFNNSTIPALRGALLTFVSLGSSPPTSYSIRWAEGTTYKFTSYTYGSAYLTSIVDLNGNTTTINRNPSQPMQITSVTDPTGRSLTFTYDAANRITQIADPIGRKVKYAYNTGGTLAAFVDANGGITGYTYDNRNNLATITDARGILTEQNTYNESFDGRISQQVSADGAVTSFAYSLQNPGVATSPVLQTVVTDPLGRQTTYRYNTQGFLTSVTDASGQTRTLIRDPNHFNLVSDYIGSGTCPVCGDPAAGDVHYTYDAMGNVLTRTDALGHTVAFSYDTRFNSVNSVTDASGQTTTIAYSSNGNPISGTDANGNTTQTAYDSFGEPVQTTGPTGAITVTAYDSFGNATSVTNALRNTTSFSYDGAGRLTQVQDALGRKSIALYDSLDQISRLTDPLGQTTGFQYDSDGNLLSYTDAKSNTVHFYYDSVGRIQSRISQLGRTESYQYDGNSNLTQYTDRRGQTSRFQYDEVNRLTNEIYIDANVTRGYDANGRLLTVNDTQGGQFGFTYDSAGSLVKQNEPTGTVQYTRDPLKRIATRQAVGQASVGYTYDPVGNMLSALALGAGVSYQYNALNLPTSLSRTNGVVTNYSYNQLGQVISIIHSRGGALNTQTYTYDNVGNRSVSGNDISQPQITQATHSSFDSANQVMTNAQTQYSYDFSGNRLSEVGLSSSINYAWDGRNRLSAIQSSDGSTTAFRYDFARNLLQVKSVAGISTSLQSFLLDEITNAVSISNNTDPPVAILTGNRIDSHFASVDAFGNAQFGISDALGSTTGITDSAGNLTSSLKYEPFGQTTGTPPATYPFAYTGRMPVSNNIYYYRNRYYDTSTGQFLSEDPLDIIGGVNHYAYANNNPISASDPFGLDSDLEDQIGAIKCIGIGEGLGAEFALELVAAEQSVAEALKSLVDVKEAISKIKEGKESPFDLRDKLRDAKEKYDEAVKHLKEVESQSAALRAFRDKCRCYK